jgi:hypothetical protein
MPAERSGDAKMKSNQATSDANYGLPLKISVAAAYAAMVAVNFLANALPIGGVTTGEASAAYPNLFTPAGVTFSIWGLIYLLLFAYTLCQFGHGRQGANPGRDKLFAATGRLFIFASLANIAWIFAWHHGVIWLSVLIMLALLFSLIRIADGLDKAAFALKETLCVRLPFGVYFGWITVATIANITVFLVSLGWKGFGVAESAWTVIVLLLGTAIGTWRLLKGRDFFYGSALVWAYGGIWLKHASPAGFNGKYPIVIATTIVCIVLFLGAMGFMARRKGRR